jgi:hypothetical protein
VTRPQSLGKSSRANYFSHHKRQRYLQRPSFCLQIIMRLTALLVAATLLASSGHASFDSYTALTVSPEPFEISAPEPAAAPQPDVISYEFGFEAAPVSASAPAAPAVPQAAPGKNSSKPTKPRHGKKMHRTDNKDLSLHRHHARAHPTYNARHRKKMTMSSGGKVY